MNAMQTREEGAPSVYLDHNATAPLRPEVGQLWHELTAEGLGNPSSLHASGRRARDVIDQARERVAMALGVLEDEVVFTASGTEANNVALFGRAGALPRDRSILVGPTEHPSVLAVMDRLEAAGRKIRRLAVDHRGLINLEQLAFLTEQAKVGLISIQLANNEVGTVQPLAELATYSTGDGDGPRPTLHVDAVQALGRLPLDLGGELRHVDLCSLSMHKVGGPLGVGLLIRRRGLAMAPHLFGGGQEEGLRPGTENPAAIGAAALAVQLAVRDQQAHAKQVRELTDELFADLSRELPSLTLIGPPIDDHAARLPNTLCLSVDGMDARMLVTRLDLHGIEVSAGSACSSGAVEASHVLLAMGYDDATSRTGLRFSLGQSTTRSDCKRAVDVLVKVISPSLATRDNQADL